MRPCHAEQKRLAAEQRERAQRLLDEAARLARRTALTQDDKDRLARVVLLGRKQ